MKMKMNIWTLLEYRKRLVRSLENTEFLLALYVLHHRCIAFLFELCLPMTMNTYLRDDTVVRGLLSIVHGWLIA
jgi:hypothetical protein